MKQLLTKLRFWKRKDEQTDPFMPVVRLSPAQIAARAKREAGKAKAVEVSPNEPTQ